MSAFDFSEFSYQTTGLDGAFENTVRFASVQEFRDYVKKYQFQRVSTKIAGSAGVLVNKATRDFWQVEADGDGVVIRRLNDENDPTVSF